MKNFTRRAAVLGLTTGMIAASQSAFASHLTSLEVTITNLTAGQTFTPVLVASHQPGLRVFSAGGEASEELEILAEQGNPAPLMSSLTGQPGVLDATTADGPLPPGQSLTLTVRSRGNFDHVSVGAMLVPTNDGFFALNGVEAPRGRDTAVFRGPAYDAGTEINDESCANIPGPPTICQGEGFNASREGAEGFVHIHRGIHGTGDLDPTQQDWRNPVVQVNIERMVGGS